MIDKFELIMNLDLLSKHFGKELLPEVIVIWSKYLNKNLNTEEFCYSVENAIITSNFMPTPSQLVEFVNGSKKAQAVKEWQLVLMAASGRELHPEALSSRALVALRGIGGVSAVGMSDQRRREWLEKDFIELYVQCTEKDVLSLPQADYKEVHKREEPPSVPIPEHIKKQVDDLLKKRGEK